MWILWKLRFHKCEFHQNWGWQNAIFFGQNMDFCPSVEKQEIGILFLVWYHNSLSVLSPLIYMRDDACNDYELDVMWEGMFFTALPQRESWKCVKKDNYILPPSWDFSQNNCAKSVSPRNDFWYCDVKEKLPIIRRWHIKSEMPKDRVITS